MGIRPLKKLRSFFKGWAALLSGKTPDYARIRLYICQDCPKNVRFKFWIIDIVFWICGACGCPLHAKARSKDEDCPHPYGSKWPKV